MLFKTTHRTPIGLLYLISSEDVLLGAGFRSFEDLLERMDPDDSSLEAKNVKTIPIISDLIADYFAGDFSALGGIKVRQPGEKFSQAIWKAMRKIPAGKTLSYSDLAARAGSPAAVREIGRAHV